MRTAILGNAGSGKTTLARSLAQGGSVAVLDLDTIYWAPGKVAVERPAAQRLADLRRFCDEHESWVIEGCYADLIEATFPWRPELIFLDPGREVCLRHCRARPFELHKYGTKEEQARMLDFLLRWVAGYYERDGTMPWRGHRASFEQYDGPKRVITKPEEA
jgi:adenylate kinase family enzyme